MTPDTMFGSGSLNLCGSTELNRIFGFGKLEKYQPFFPLKTDEYKWKYKTAYLPQQLVNAFTFLANNSTRLTGISFVWQILKRYFKF